MRISGSIALFSRWRCCITLFLAALLAHTVHAQAAHWENGESSTGSLVQLVFEDCHPDGDVQLPPIDGATLAFAGQSTNTSYVNGDVSNTVTIAYFIRNRRGGAVQIPAFTVKTNKGNVQVAAFNTAAPAVNPDSIARSKLTPSRTTVWVGEVFDLTYQLTAARRNNPQINPTFEWNPAPLVAEDWSKPEVEESTAGGQRQLLVTFRTRAYAKTANTLKLEAASHQMNIQTGSISFGLLAQPRMEPISVTSDQPTIEIRALPTPPAGFNGAVGQFKLTSKVVPDHASVGEPITWTFELTGSGNWPDISSLPSREVSKDFQVVQPKAKRTPVEGKLFEATLTEDVVLMPTKAGTYTLPATKFIYFDPQSGSYKTLRTDPTTLTIAAPAAPVIPIPTTTPSTGAATSPEETKPATPAKPLQSPAAPGAIPRDPLPGSDHADIPLKTSRLVSCLLAPLPCLLLLWFALAWRRATRTDPLRPQREAHARIGAVLAELRTSTGRPEAVIAAQLLQWQHDTARLWQIRHAAPNAAALQHFGDANAAEWIALWREADRAIYGAQAALPSDWIPRAEAALAAKRVPGFKPYRLFLPGNLLPFAAMLALGLLATPRHTQAAIDPIVTYRSGEFAAAEKAWRDVVSEHPTDWIARHNLALALAQQDRNGEALAEATAAFVQHPNNPSVRWHFEWTATKAGFAPPPLLPFLKEGPIASIADKGSPASWQRRLILAAFLVAGGLGWMMVNAYGARSGLQFGLAGGLCGIAAIVGVIALFGLLSYGETADSRAVVVWHNGTLRSIPTEADTTQKTTTLSAGSVAIMDREFLGWNRLVFSNGQTGWVRKEEVVPLWR